MVQGASTISCEIPLAGWTQSLKRSALQDMLAASARPGILSFALGLPAAELFPVEHYGQAVARVLSTDERALQYGPPLPSLKKHIVKLMEWRGVRCRAEQVFLTAGAQQGVHMLTRLLLDQGGRVVTEEMTYTGFQQVLQPYSATVLTVPTDLQTGMDVESLERLLETQERPSLIYSVTDGHNPLSVSMSREKRQQLVQLASRFHVPIIEDDPYGFLFYEERCTPPLRAFDEQCVYYVGTFSKILAPGLRTGWLVVPEEFILPLSVIKESIDLDMAPLSQRAVSDYLAAGHLEAHLKMLRLEYGRRRDAMHEALVQYFPAQARWHKPASGLFFWVELPEEVDAVELLGLAIEKEQLAFIPGCAFNASARPAPFNTMRLNFSNSSVERIDDGIKRLARILKSLLAGRSTGP